MRIGEKWAALECTSIEDRTAPGDFGNGRFTKYFKEYELKCKCGEVVYVLSKEFPGKRQMRDCGKCNSGFGSNCSMVALYMPENAITVLNEHHMQNKQLSRGGAAAELILLGWQKYLESK